jgi:hypothetical protein
VALKATVIIASNKGTRQMHTLIVQNPLLQLEARHRILAEEEDAELVKEENAGLRPSG